MAIKMLMFDFRDEEKSFFETENVEDFDITFYTESLTEDFLEKISDEEKQNTSVISIFIESHINQKIIDAFPNLMIIATRSTGFDHIDLENCKHKRIKVLNVENYGKSGVMQYTFGLIINIVRKMYSAIYDVKNFQKNDKAYIGRDLNKLTLGVIGTGTIGKGVCMIANAFGMKILAYDVCKRNSLINNYNVQYVDKDVLLEKSDIITLHMPLNPSSYHIISKKELELMKKTAYLINVSRGELINTEELYNALKSNEIAGCALDVIECENSGIFDENNPHVEEIKECSEICENKKPILRELIQMPNVLITPHIAYKTQDAIDYILKTTFLSIKDNLKGGHTNKII